MPAISVFGVGHDCESRRHGCRRSHRVHHERAAIRPTEQRLRMGSSPHASRHPPDARARCIVGAGAPAVHGAVRRFHRIPALHRHGLVLGPQDGRGTGRHGDGVSVRRHGPAAGEAGGRPPDVHAQGHAGHAAAWRVNGTADVVVCRARARGGQCPLRLHGDFHQGSQANTEAVVSGPAQ